MYIQEFWREVQEQRPKMESVISSGKQMTMERHWPQDTAESLRAGYSGVQSRWKWVLSEAEDWGKLLEIVLPEIEKFQVRGIEGGHSVSHNKSNKSAQCCSDATSNGLCVFLWQ